MSQESTPPMTHWRSFLNPKYMGAYSFHPDDKPIYTIQKCVSEKVKGSSGREDDCAVLYFEEPGVKPMIVNSTNGKTLEKLFTPFVQNWAGKKVQLHIVAEKVQGEMTNVLRVRQREPKGDLPWLPADKMEIAIQNLKAGAVSVDSIQKKYRLTGAQIQAMEMALEDTGAGPLDNSQQASQ